VRLRGIENVAGAQDGSDIILLDQSKDSVDSAQPRAQASLPSRHPTGGKRAIRAGLQCGDTQHGYGVAPSISNLTSRIRCTSGLRKRRSC